MNIGDFQPIGNAAPLQPNNIQSDGGRKIQDITFPILHSTPLNSEHPTYSASNESSNKRNPYALSVGDASQLSNEFSSQVNQIESSHKLHTQTERSEIEQKSLNNSQDALNFLDQELSEPNEKNIDQPDKLQANGEKSEIEQKAINNSLDASNFLDQELSDSNEKNANGVSQVSNTPQNLPNTVEQRSSDNTKDVSSFLDQLEPPVDNDSVPNAANNSQLPENDLEQQEQEKGEYLKRVTSNTTNSLHDISNFNKAAAIDKTQAVTSFSNIPLSNILLVHPSNLKEYENGKKEFSVVTADQAHNCPHALKEMVAIGAQDEAGNFRFDPRIHRIIQGRIAAGLPAPVNLNGKKVDFAGAHKHLLGKALSDDEIGSLQIIARNGIAKILAEKLEREKKIDEDMTAQNRNANELNGSAKGQWSKETEAFVKSLILTVPLTVAATHARKIRQEYEAAVAKKAEQEKRTQRIFKERAEKAQRKKDDQIKQETLTATNLQNALQAERNKLNGVKNMKVIGMGEYTAGDVIVRTTMVATQMAKQSFSTTFKTTQRAQLAA